MFFIKHIVPLESSKTVSNSRIIQKAARTKDQISQLVKYPKCQYGNTVGVRYCKCQLEANNLLHGLSCIGMFGKPYATTC